MPEPKPEPDLLLERAIPVAQALIEEENFSIENLCHGVDCSLKDLVGAIGSMDELFLHINERFMTAYVDKAARLEATAKDGIEAIGFLCAGWLDHALAHPQSMNVLLQHQWAEGFERPDWYKGVIASCFAPIEKHLRTLAPQAPPEAVAGVARGLYAHIVGLYFLSINERAQPAGIASLRKLLNMNIALLVKGLGSL